MIRLERALGGDVHPGVIDPRSPSRVALAAPPLLATTSFDWTITDSNKAPLLRGIREQSGAELTRLSFTASATDPDGNIFEDPSLLHDFFGTRLDAVIDGGPVAGMASSVVSLIDDEPEIIRYGAGDVSTFE